MRELHVTASWTSAQPRRVVLEVADHLLVCIKGLLYLAGPFRVDDDVNGPTPPPRYWDFNTSESSDLGLWEVPIEGTTFGEVLPAIVLPTRPIMLFLTRAGRAIIGQRSIFEGPQFQGAREKLGRLRRWVYTAEGLVSTRANRRCLIDTKLGALEEVKGWYEDTSSDDLLLQFINQAEAPQTCAFVDGEGSENGEIPEETSESDHEYSDTESLSSIDGLS